MYVICSLCAFRFSVCVCNIEEFYFYNIFKGIFSTGKLNGKKSWMAYEWLIGREVVTLTVVTLITIALPNA